MVAGTDLSDLRKLTVVKLRDRLAKLGLSTSGLKADLVERLFKHYKEEDENEDEGGRDNMDTNIPPPVEAPRTALQLRLQQMAGQPNKDGSTGSGPAPPPPSTSKPAPSMTRSQPPPSTRSQPPPSTRSQPPPSLLSQPVQPPRSQMVQQPAAGGPPSLLSGPQIRPPGPPGPPPGMQSQPPPRPPNSQPMGQSSQQYGGPPPQQMSQSNPPRGVAPQMVQPTPARQQIPPPPPHMMLPPPVQEPDLQEKIAMQTRMLEQERKQQQEQQRMQEQQRIAEQQQKERLAIQQQAMLLQQQKNESEDSNTGLMEKVRQQQMMLEQQKQKERLEQQQQAMMEQQNQAIKKQEEERRQKEAELLRQQQIALMEAQRDKQEKQMREERAPPRPQRPPIEPLMSQNAPFNPRPGMLNMPHGGPREMMPPTTSSMSYVPPHSSSGRIPPLLPPDSNEPIRPPRRGTPPDERPEKQEPKEMKLAPALEKVLAFKDVRAQEVGLTPEEIEKLNMPEEKPVEDEHEIEMVEMEEEDNEEEELEEEVVQTESKKESKNKRRKKKKKKTKKVRTMEPTKRRLIIPLDKKDEVQIEYVQEQLDLDPSDPNYFTFSKIFEMFKISEEPVEVPKVEEPVPVKPAEPKPKGQFDSSSDEDDEDADEKQDDRPKLSKKKLKKLTRLSVAQLKQLVARPDVVEMHDVTAQDPRLCVHLKATRNTVPVPRHWCFKRKYLQGKRGIEKPPFELPDYIQATGITEMRAALAEKEDQKNLKAKMREKVRPKMGKIDIDYQKLHDAFFRWQTKPKMTIHGDLYYEGKEFETRLKEKKPGNITDDLKTALGMPIGHGSEKVPPPWLIAMQRYGPPPSYPNLKIPGLNAPIPETCTFGYHAGGWGKPPVDENGKPLYGDVFGTKGTDFETVVQEDDIDQSHWGELESESESEEESSEEEEEEGPEESGLMTPAEGLVTPSGITSIPVGMETPDMIELRKRRIEDAMDQGGETPALYQVLPEKKSGVGAAMMGSAHIYDVPGLAAKKPGEKGAMEGVEIALNPEELDLDTAAMQAKYDQTIREQQSQLEKEDLSDMVAEHAAKQKKRKKKQDETGKAAKKYKEFKF